jgi:outer membrane cobalamin receptor
MSDRTRGCGPTVSRIVAITTYLVFFVLLTAAIVSAQAAGAISGFVRDQNGASVAQASVRFTPTGRRVTRETTTDENGRFTIEQAENLSGVITVEAAGFQPYRIEINSISPTELQIDLHPAAVAETVTVIRTASRIEDTPESVVVIGPNELQATPAVTLDDKLRQVPGFSLFRRAGSRTANPTTQGVSLRGVGASGASRALVLADGVPLNDPFGGWIYWGRIPVESISQVEMLRGPGSDLYGTSAIGGVVSLVSKRPSESPILDLETFYGTQNTPQISAFASAGRSGWLGSLGVEAFRTNGFVIVDEPFRGSVDTPANVRRIAIDPAVEKRFGSDSRVFAQPYYYEERRNNGTPLQTNDTRVQGLVLGGDRTTQSIGSVTARLYVSQQSYHQSFTSVAADRNSESLTRLQSSPSQAVGFSGQWLRSFSGKYTVYAGTDGREVRGRSDEVGYSGNSATSLSSAGGREFTIGVFAGGNVSINSRLLVSGGVRFDRWRNFDGHSSTKPLRTGLTSTTDFDPRVESAVSPRISALLRLTRNVSLTGSARLGFRQPTLNELYRSFRVGDVLTLANAALEAERAASGEGGIIANAFGRRTLVRADAFCTEISQPVANVTLSITPSLTTRQRQNLGSTRSCGLEVDAQHRVNNYLSLSAGYLFVDARVVSFPVNPVIEGLSLPQVPRSQFTFQALFSDPRLLSASVQFRASSRQFEDDLNQLPLAAYGTVDGMVSRRIARGTEVFAAVENLLDARIVTGRTPVPTITGNRQFRFGLRLSLGERAGR